MDSLVHKSSMKQHVVLTKFMGLLNRVICLAGLVVFSMFMASGTSYAEPPAVKFEKGTLISPSAANSYYGSSTTHTKRLCQLLPDSEFCDAGYRAVHIKELARTLGKDRLTNTEYTQNVYEYVYMNIETEFRYGLSKGGFGALLDQSGTPFDQANLMVELLREAGVSASYKAGTITLSSNQFSRWSGFYTTLNESTQATTVLKSAACQFLADGGIPASCSGSTNLTNITLSTAWVSSGGKLYNPSYKTHELKAGLPNLTTLMGCGTGCGTQVMNAGLVGKIGTDSIGTYARNIDETGISNKLKSFAINLENHIRTNMPDADLIDIIGGKEDPAREDMPEATSSLPYGSAVQKTWSGNVPDKYRTRLGIKFDNLSLNDGSSGASLLSSKALYADELMGQAIHITGVREGEDWPRQRTMYLQVSPVSSPGVAAFGGSGVIGTSVKSVYDDELVYQLSINHPYASTSGNYMDFSLSDDIFIWKCQPPFVDCNDIYQPNLIATYPINIPFFLGRVGGGQVQFVNKALALLDRGIFLPGTAIDSAQSYDTSVKWIHQSQRISEISQRLMKTHANFHSAIGAVKVVSASINVSTETRANALNVSLSADHFNLLNNISLTSQSGSTADERRFEYITANLLNAFEGSAIDQDYSFWDGSSVNAMVSMANKRSYKLYNVSSSNRTSFLNGSSNYNSLERTVLNEYLLNGYNIVAPINGDLGQYGGSNTYATIIIAPVLASKNGRAAFLTSLGAKGGQSSTGNTKKPSIDPKEFGDFDSGFNPTIDLASGEFSMTLSPDLVSGQGDFPQSLPFVRTYSHMANATTRPLPVDVLDPNFIYNQAGLQPGWSHNYQTSVTFKGDGDRALGGEAGYEAANAIAATATMSQFATSDFFKFKLINSFTADWLTDQIQLNVVLVNKGSSPEYFYRTANGQYRNLAAPSAEIQFGSQPVKVESVYGFLYQFKDVSIQAKGTEGDVMTFAFQHDAYQRWADTNGASSYSIGLGSQELLATHWTYPDGNRLDYDYEVGLPGGDPTVLVTKVQNSFGRELHFPHISQLRHVDEGGGTLTYYAEDETSRRVSFYGNWIFGGNEVEFPDGHVTRFVQKFQNGSYAGSFDIELYLTATQEEPTHTIEFDSLRRASALIDGSGVKVDYFSAGVSSERYSRGEMVDALGNTTTSYFDDGGRPLMTIEPSYEEANP